MNNFVLSALLVLGLGGCSQKLSFENIEFEDLKNFPQYTQAYEDNIKTHTELLDVQENYDEKYFSPWHYTKPPFECDSILWPHRSYTYENSFGENLLPLAQEWFISMNEKGNYEAYGSLNKKAISLDYLDLRSFPTHKPIFKNPKIAGQGYPFDYLQNSGVNANEPLYVSHLTRDGQWAYIFTSYATGWVPFKDIAYIEDDIAQLYENARHIEVSEDGFTIKDEDQNFVFKSRVGMRLPLISIEKTHYVALAITGGKQHSPVYTKVNIPFVVAREGQMKLNTQNLIHITDLMLQSKYGWGGLNEERDCSSTLRDLYAPFGIWLPRNSSQQAKVGKVISLEGLSIEEKKAKIIEEAIPFETLLYKQGHILLYLGQYKDKIAVLHNAWGVKTIDNKGEGRKIIGRTVISSLDIGKEFKDYDDAKGLMSQLISMNIITQEEQLSK